MRTKTRHLIVVLGDQLNLNSAAFAGFDPKCDVVWMAEAAGESEHVWTHKARIAMFLSAMRHFRDLLVRKKWPVEYRQLDESKNRGCLAKELAVAVKKFRPAKVIVVRPGEWRVEKALQGGVDRLGIELEVRPDRHFICELEEFAAHAQGRKQLRMEFFYREMRRKTGVLMEGDKPSGGSWNFDAENRGSFGKSGPGKVPLPTRFPPDKITRGVLALVGKRFLNHPGKLEFFDWPVTRRQALIALGDFIKHRLPDFGKYQDAMWSSVRCSQQSSQPVASTQTKTARGKSASASDAYLFHSRLSAALNLKLLDPREVVAAAESAYRRGKAPLASVEGFIRQILGWREFVRGVYWYFMPAYLELNQLRARAPLPEFYWTGRTEMNCLRETIRQTLEFGYAHHIQRLMVTGLFSLLLGVKPQAVHEWYLAMYVDAVEWVELPNTLGMSQFADGGIMASKPYVASGKYIQRMSNYCDGCRFDPAQRSGARACPFTVLYWEFLIRHAKQL